MKRTININGIKCGKLFDARKVAASNKMVSFMIGKHQDVAFACDALEPIKLMLARPDVAAGVAKDHTKCAFANAVCRTFRADDAYVGIRMACLKFGDTLVRFMIPQSVSREIVCFDRYKDCDVSEKSYQLSAVLPFRRIGRKTAAPKTTGRKMPAKVRRGHFVTRHVTKRIRRALYSQETA